MVTRPQPFKRIQISQANYIKNGRRGYLEGITVHTTDGGVTIEALDGWYNHRDNPGASTFCGIGPSGSRTGPVELHQYGDINDRMFSQGKLCNSLNTLVKTNKALGYDPNDTHIGFELTDEGTPGKHSEAQYEMLAHAAAWYWQEWIQPNAEYTGATVDREHVIGHFEIDNCDRRFCPSIPEWRFTWLIDKIKWHLNDGGLTVPGPDYKQQLMDELLGELRSTKDNRTVAADLVTRLDVQRGTIEQKLRALGLVSFAHGEQV